MPLLLSGRTLMSKKIVADSNLELKKGLITEVSDLTMNGVTCLKL